MNPIYSFMDEYERDMVVASRELEIATTISLSYSSINE